jgi:hypothetical protein
MLRPDSFCSSLRAILIQVTCELCDHRCQYTGFLHMVSSSVLFCFMYCRPTTNIALNRAQATKYHTTKFCHGSFAAYSIGFNLLDCIKFWIEHTSVQP